MSASLDIALAQINPIVGDIDGNIAKILAVWKKHQTCDLIVFSEAVTVGYPADDLLLNSDFIQSVQEKISFLAKEGAAFNAGILIGTPWNDAGTLRNAALLIGDGKIQKTIYKSDLPNYGVFDEKRYFKPPAQFPDCIDYKDLKIGVIICEDMWTPALTAHYKQQGAQQLIVINGSPFHRDVAALRHKQASSRCKESGLPLIYVNQVGGQDDLVFDGTSFILNKDGVVTSRLPSFTEYSCKVSDAPLAPELPKIEKYYKACVLGLQDYVTKNGFKGILIGMSGGVDSALSATMAADAIGADNVHCVMLPSPYTSQDSLDDAKECANMLNIQYDVIPITQAMGALHTTLAIHTDKSKPHTTFENIQSRLRGLILMALSNETGKMLLTTGNKSEMAVGYATLYGDMCGGYNALKDIYKTEVYELCRYRNSLGKVIPERILTKAPSAELKPNQTDQDTLPPYDILDSILEHLIEQNTLFKNIPFDSALVTRVAGMLKYSEYKRYQAPPGPKVTAKAFGRDRRYPMTNGFLKKT